MPCYIFENFTPELTMNRFSEPSVDFETASLELVPCSSMSLDNRLSTVYDFTFDDG